jgi:tRNA(Ile)-lysidine synthase
MLTEFEKKVAGFVKAERLFDRADRVLLAVSGGADSTALLYAMLALKDEGVLGAELICAHINHQLRGVESDGDEKFVIAEARNLSLEVTTRRVDVRGFARKNKLSIETAARKLRIESLLDIAKANNCNRIATAHQKDDNAETVLQRLVRGTGFRGLGGIWPMRKFADDISFVRPLLCVGRDEIIEYLEGRNLKWRTDKTNEDCKYRRNFIRHRLIPELQQEFDGSVVEQLFDLSQSAQRFYSLVCSCADKVWPELIDCSGDKLKLELKSFSNQPEPVKVEVVRRSLARLGGGERDLTQQHYKEILQLAEQNIGGRKIILPAGFVVSREYGNLVFARAKETIKPDGQISKSVRVKIPGQTRFGRYLIEATILDSPVEKESAAEIEKKLKTVERFDLDKISLPLVVRPRRTGDKFWPLGLAGEKRVGKFLTAAKVPRELRKELLIVADSEKIIWLWPIRMSEQAKVTAETQKVLQLQITDFKD